MNTVTSPWVLDEDDALELLAYLTTAARTQVEEAAEYGPMRLLTAAHRLAEVMTSRASPGTAEVLAGQLARMPLLAVPRDERGSYVEELDGICRELAAHLVSRYGPGAP
jgi:alkylation response protein AidB-like acyl-CoA dehydrogenase